MHGSGEMDCQSAISTIPVIEQKIPKMAMIRLSNLSRCSSSLQSNKKKVAINRALVSGGVTFLLTSDVESFIGRGDGLLASKGE